MLTKDAHTEIARSATVVGAGTLLSRVFGLIRDAVIGMVFPAATSLDAFFVAFGIPNLLRRLFGEGALNNAFVPVFSDYLANKPKDEAFRLARIVLTALLIVLTAICAVAMLFAPWIVKLQVLGWTGGQELGPEKVELTTRLLRIMLPYMILICLTAVAAAALNSMRHFAAGAFHPVLLNVSLIASALFLASGFREPAIALAVGVLIGGVLQLLLQVPPLWRRGFRFKPAIDVHNPGLKKVMALMLPATVGFGVVEINALVDRLIASFLPHGSVTYLYYANRLVQLPLALFGITVAVPLLPKLSTLHAQGDGEGFKSTFALGMRLIVFFTLPSSVGLILLREPIVNLLFERGEFTSTTTDAVAFALLYYSVGLFAFAATKLAATVFYSRKDARTPVIIASIALVANVVLNIILMQFLAHAGLALASSISSLINFVLLVYLAGKRGVVAVEKSDWASMVKSIAATALMALVCLLLLGSVGYDPSASFAVKLGQLAVTLLGSLATFILASRLLKCDELSLFLTSFKRRLRPSR